MKNIKTIFLVIFLSLGSCKTYTHIKEYGASCYWMENYSGKFEWISVKDALGKKYSKEECFAADSCDGGLGESGGGCYKWAKTASSSRFSWDEVKKSDKK